MVVRRPDPRICTFPELESGAADSPPAPRRSTRGTTFGDGQAASPIQRPERGP